VVAAISREHLRRILHAAGVSEMTWILALYDYPSRDGRVICVDEFGPLNLQPAGVNAGARADHRPGFARPTAVLTGSCTCWSPSI
jgi:hypothetical protein